MLQRVQQRILLKRHSVRGRTCMTILILLAIACVSAFVVRCLWEVQFSGKYSISFMFSSVCTEVDDAHDL